MDIVFRIDNYICFQIFYYIYKWFSKTYCFIYFKSIGFNNNNFDLHIPNKHLTHHTDTFYTLLDLYFVDSERKLTSFSQSGYPFLSGHEIIFLAYNIRKPVRESRNIRYRDFKNLNSTSLASSLTHFLSLANIDYSNLNESILKLNDVIHHAFDECVPVRSLALKNPPTPWMTPRIKLEIAHKNKLRNFFKRFRTPYHKELYKTQLKIVNNMIQISKTHFYTS